MNAKTQEAAKQDEASTEQAAPDRFANLPTVKLNEAEVEDMSGLAVSNPRKYQKISDAAIAARLPMQSGWKHTSAVFVPGAITKEYRAGSVFGTIQDAVKRAGKAGINSFELCAAVRRAQIGNKRSHYCTELPPVGWAEGYINSAVTQGIVGVHGTRKAPALTAPVAEPAKDEKKDGTNG